MFPNIPCAPLWSVCGPCFRAERISGPDELDVAKPGEGRSGSSLALSVFGDVMSCQRSSCNSLIGASLRIRVFHGLGDSLKPRADFSTPFFPTRQVGLLEFEDKMARITRRDVF